MFGAIRTAIRAFAVGVAVGMLFAPRAGVETRRMLSERLVAGLNQLLEVAALPPVQPDQARTDAHSTPRATKATRAAGTDARTS